MSGNKPRIRPEFPADIFEYTNDKIIEIIFQVRTNNVSVKIDKNIVIVNYKEESENERREVTRRITLPEDYIYKLKNISIKNNVCSITIEKRVP